MSSSLPATGASRRSRRRGRSGGSVNRFRLLRLFLVAFSYRVQTVVVSSFGCLIVVLIIAIVKPGHPFFGYVDKLSGPASLVDVGFHVSEVAVYHLYPLAFFTSG